MPTKAEKAVADSEKEKVWAHLEMLGVMLPRWTRRRPDWRVSGDKTLSVFLTFSQERSEPRPFFDVHVNDLSIWLSYPRSFVIFIIGEQSNALVVPVPVLQEKLSQQRKPAGDGTFKLHPIDRRGAYGFRELPGLNLAPFHNNYAPLT